MSRAVMTRWVVRMEFLVGGEDTDGTGAVRRDTFDSWVCAAFEAYVEESDALRDIRGRGLSLALAEEELPELALLGRPQKVVLGATVVELGADSFTFVVRARPLGAGTDAVAQGRWTVTIRDAAGAVRPVEPAVRRSLIQIEQRAGLLV
jgi:acyl-CoA thioesterase FadM